VVRLTGHDGDPTPLTREALTGLDWLHGDIAVLRQRYEEACRIVPDRATWQAINADGREIGLLIHTPLRTKRSDRLVVYCHGGGWIVGSPLTHADISGALCDISGIGVISVDYRLAPEHVAPAAIDDALAAVEYALSRLPNRDNSVILVGDSAGAAIALAVASQGRQPWRVRIGGVAACYGSYGLLDSESLRLLGSRADGLDRDCLQRMWLAANPSGKPSPYAIDSIIRGISAPVYVLTGDRDPLIDDSLALAQALKRQNRSVVLDIVEAASHGFLHGGHASPVAKASLERMAAWMERI
jgi:acetyl esterase